MYSLNINILLTVFVIEYDDTNELKRNMLAEKFYKQ